MEDIRNAKHARITGSQNTRPTLFIVNKFLGVEKESLVS
jgi:hypothetical protein